MSPWRRLSPGKARFSAFVGILALPLLASCAYDDGYYDPSPGYGYGYGGYGYGGYGYNYGYGNPCWPYGCNDWHHGRHHRHGWGDDDGDGDNGHHHHGGGGMPGGGGTPGGGPPSQPPSGPGPQAHSGPDGPFPYPLWNKQQRDSKQ